MKAQDGSTELALERDHNHGEMIEYLLSNKKQNLKCFPAQLSKESLEKQNITMSEAILIKEETRLIGLPEKRKMKKMPHTVVNIKVL